MPFEPDAYQHEKASAAMKNEADANTEEQARAGIIAALSSAGRDWEAGNFVDRSASAENIKVRYGL